MGFSTTFTRQNNGISYGGFFLTLHNDSYVKTSTKNISVRIYIIIKYMYNRNVYRLMSARYNKKGTTTEQFDNDTNPRVRVTNNFHPKDFFAKRK